MNLEEAKAELARLDGLLQQQKLEATKQPLETSAPNGAVEARRPTRHVPLKGLPREAVPPRAMNEQGLKPAARPSIQDAFQRGATSPVGTKMAAGAIPAVMIPNHKNHR